MNVTTPASTRRVSDSDLVKALSILVSPVFGALSMANGLAGFPSDPWRILATYTPLQIMDEVIARGIDLDGVRASCSQVLVLDTPVLHMILEHDPRPRCPLCCRRHLHRDGVELSCGRSARSFNPPAWRWTRSTAEAAVEGTYKP